jgi:4-hydroxy-3-polyprenylbenzoate decarboxylase
MKNEKQKIISLAITGASGVQYGFRLLEILLQKQNTVYLMISKAAQVVIGMETDIALPGRCSDMQKFLVDRYACEASQLHVFGEDEWTAPTASGGGLIDAMVICPCSMGALSAVATGARPYSDIHLENMLKLSRMGAVMLCANPGFYNHAETIDDLIDFVVAKILDQLNISHQLQPRWGE